MAATENPLPAGLPHGRIISGADAYGYQLKEPEMSEQQVDKTFTWPRPPVYGSTNAMSSQMTNSFTVIPPLSSALGQQR